MAENRHEEFSDRPSKRRATSSPPEEGELEDGALDVPPPTTHPLPPKPLHVTASGSSSSKFKVPFPFKTTNGAQSSTNSALPKVNGSDYDRPNDRSGIRRQEEFGRHNRQGKERRRPNAADSYMPSSENRWRDSSGSKLPGTSDSYVPRDRSRSRSRSRERGRDSERHWVPNTDYSSDYERRHYKGSPHTRSPSATPRGASPPTRSRSPPSRPSQKQKHRLPTPRSSTLVSPSYSATRDRGQGNTRDLDRDFGRPSGDHYEPYDRDFYRDHERDPRGQYMREDADDWDRDRYYRPSNYDYHSFSRYPQSPVYRPQSPPRRTLERPRTPQAPLLTRTPPIPPPPRSPPIPPPPRTPPPPVPIDSRIIHSQQTVPRPPTPSNKDKEQAREAQALSLARPGAPNHTRSPASMANSFHSLEQTPSMHTGPETTLIPEATPSTLVSKRKRTPVRRSREQEKEAYQRVFIGCGSRDDYDVMTKLGEGTFGEVHKALQRGSRKVVALKRIMMHNEEGGLPVTALREIKILKMLHHPCIVELYDMFIIASKGKKSPMSVYMVFPYMDHDLAGLLENERVKLTPSQIKLYMRQLLEGTEYMHHNNIVHRDMKAANLLISNDGSLKIADFGLARAFTPVTSSSGRERKYTNCVVTRWYRPPELLLGSHSYGGEIDIWGIGCVLGEMFMRRPILPGESDLNQLEKIWSICGSPNQQNWPDYDTLPGCKGQIRFRPQERRIKVVYESLGQETCALLDQLLILDPRERISASQALDHEYFWSDPMPADPKTLPSYEASHEFDQRGRRHVQPMDGSRNIRPEQSTRPGVNALQAQRGTAPANQHGPYNFGEGYGLPGSSSQRPPFRPPNNRAPPHYAKHLPPLPSGAGLPARPPVNQQFPVNVGRGSFPPQQRRPYNGVGQPDFISGHPHGGGGLNYG